MSIKTKVAVAGIITTTVLLFTYVSFRSGSIESEYIKTLAAQTDRIAVAFTGFEKEKPAAGRNLNRFLAEMNRENANMALLAVADGSNRVLAGGKNDRYIRDRALFDEITAAFARGEFAPRKNADYAVRYFEQTKFYIYVKDTSAGRLLIAFPYKLRGKLMIKLLLEIALIVILAVVFTTALYLYLARRERPLPTKESPSAARTTEPPPETGPDGGGGSVVRAADGLAFVGRGRTTEPPPEPGPESEDRPEARNAAANALEAASKKYAGSNISLYIVDETMTALEKHLEFADGSHLPMDGNADTIDTTDEIGDELARGSTLVLNRGRKLIIPVMHRGDLIGAVAVSRAAAFAGPEISDLKKLSAEISRAVGSGLVH